MIPEVGRLLARGRKRALWTDGPGTARVDYGRSVIERVLPHRAPFLLVDRISAIDLEQGAIRGTRTLDPEDPVFAGHFPGAPVYPGVLLVEAIGQLASCLRPFQELGATSLPEAFERPKVMALSCHGRFVRPALPGDELTLLGVALEDDDGLTVAFLGQALRGGDVIAVAAVEGWVEE